tara:strand:+ start:48217 stop:50826 length:2610 start_codon:yes stop_codon:yes gene_type:complete
MHDSVVPKNSTIGGFISDLGSMTNDASRPHRIDDGISGLRYALILKSVELEGEYQIQDPGIIDVGSVLKNGSGISDPIPVKLHYGIPAGTTSAIMDIKPTSVDLSKCFRFYELLDDYSSTPAADRTGQVCRVEMKGVTHGLIKSFMDETQDGSPDAENTECPPGQTCDSATSSRTGPGGRRRPGRTSLSPASAAAFTINPLKISKSGTLVASSLRVVQYPRGFYCKPSNWPSNLTFFSNGKFPKGKESIVYFVLHETGGWNEIQAEKSMLLKGGGVHFMSGGHPGLRAKQQGKDGGRLSFQFSKKSTSRMPEQDWFKIFKYLPYEQKLYHCPGANSNGIGVEFCNPFFSVLPYLEDPPKKRGNRKHNFDNKNMYQQEISRTRWHGCGGFKNRKVQNTYVIPPAAQFESAYALSLKVCEDIPSIDKITASYRILENSQWFVRDDLPSGKYSFSATRMSTNIGFVEEQCPPGRRGRACRRRNKLKRKKHKETDLYDDTTRSRMGVKIRDMQSDIDAGVYAPMDEPTYESRHKIKTYRNGTKVVERIGGKGTQPYKSGMKGLEKVGKIKMVEGDQHVFYWIMGDLKRKRGKKGDGGDRSKHILGRKSGITSHQAFGGHSDGKPMELYVQLRLMGNSSSWSYDIVKKIILTHGYGQVRDSNGVPLFDMPKGVEKWKAHVMGISKDSEPVLSWNGRAFGAEKMPDQIDSPKHWNVLILNNIPGIKLLKKGEDGYAPRPDQEIEVIDRQASGFAQDCGKPAPVSAFRKGGAKGKSLGTQGVGSYSQAKTLYKHGGVVTLGGGMSEISHKRYKPGELTAEQAVIATYPHRRRDRKFIASMAAKLRAEVTHRPTNPCPAGQIVGGNNPDGSVFCVPG